MYVLNPGGFMMDMHSAEHILVPSFLDANVISGPSKRNGCMAETNGMNESTH